MWNATGARFAGRSVQLDVAQIAAPLCQVFSGQIKRMQLRPLHILNISKSSAQPGFWKLSLSHQNMSALYYALMRIPKNDR
jgi:hypothetical protein